MTGIIDQQLQTLFEFHKQGQTKFTRRMAIEISEVVFLTPKEVVQKLERMGLLKYGSWQWFVDNGGITRDNIAEVRADMAARKN